MLTRLRTLADTANPLRDGVAWRYLAVILGGFVIDLSIAWTAHELFGLDLVLAAALGFLVAMALSYFAHEFWTFRRLDSAYSASRQLKFALGSGATLATRLFVVWLSAPLEALPFGSLARLLLAFGVSLVVGFIINRLVVFGRATEPK
jgi:putative flippase GtrA